ncbi:hypothetical protein JOD97_002818 [Duganella sp. 1411]|uniref:FxDxF family PEP-CTERM protein n=1 Tax=Duganella sp. 1411 TaxID=2806572 RepID=UPI001AEB16D9|nr:FxDxF family PEP-CTERM protein [Duganella sp. 1411]MBP1204776.1 hypothetical protein [Duganella sp. 1411]
MKLKSVLATAVLAAASFSASATVHNLGVLDPSGFDSFTGASEKFGAGVAIDDTWTFTLLAPSSTSFAAVQTFAVTAGKILNFAAVLNSTSFGAPVPGAGSQTLSWIGNLAAGTYSVNVTGTTGLSGATYGATVSALPVPEPETYAMMLGGLALLGAVARRKAQK